MCAEDLLLNKLYDIVLKPDELEDDKKFNENATKEITRYIVDNPDEVSREWLFNIIEEEISKCPQGDVILVDMVPNLKFFIAL